MDHALSMRVIEGVGHLNRMAHNLIDGQRPTDQTRRQRLAVERLHHKEREAILLADVVERTNVRMAQARKRARLAFESLAACWALGNLSRQDLDRHRRGRAVYRWRDTPHPSHRVQAVPDDLVRSESKLFRERHARIRRCGVRPDSVSVKGSASDTRKMSVNGPIRIASPASSSAGAVRRTSRTNVPFLLSRSSIVARAIVDEDPCVAPRYPR